MSNSSWYIWDARVRESTLKTTALEINKIPIIMHSTFKVIYLLYFADLVIINPITLFRIDLFEAAHGWRAREGGGHKKAPLPWNLSHISYKDETWDSYTLPKEDRKKVLNHVTYPLSSADISIFSLEISKICYIRKYKCRLHFGNFLIILIFFDSLKTFLINMVAILMVSAKLAAPAFLKERYSQI